MFSSAFSQLNQETDLQFEEIIKFYRDLLVALDGSQGKDQDFPFDKLGAFSNAALGPEPPLTIIPRFALDFTSSFSKFLEKFNHGNKAEKYIRDFFKAFEDKADKSANETELECAADIYMTLDRCLEKFDKEHSGQMRSFVKETRKRILEKLHQTSQSMTSFFFGRIQSDPFSQPLAQRYMISTFPGTMACLYLLKQNEELVERDIISSCINMVGEYVAYDVPNSLYNPDVKLSHENGMEILSEVFSGNAPNSYHPVSVLEIFTSNNIPLERLEALALYAAELMENTKDFEKLREYTLNRLASFQRCEAASSAKICEIFISALDEVFPKWAPDINLFPSAP